MVSKWSGGVVSHARYAAAPQHQKSSTTALPFSPLATTVRPPCLPCAGRAPSYPAHSSLPPPSSQPQPQPHHHPHLQYLKTRRDLRFESPTHVESPSLRRYQCRSPQRVLGLRVSHRSMGVFKSIFLTLSFYLIGDYVSHAALFC